MKFEKTQVMNFEGAFRGLRNPMNSWDKSDSNFGITDFCLEETTEVTECWLRKKFHNIEELKNNNFDKYYEESEKISDWLCDEGILNVRLNPSYYVEFAFLGPNDLDLAQRMIAAGTPNDKFMRQIFVSVDITAPLYWWKEFDTYKIGTVANSTSTMHKLASTPITKECFEMDDFNKDMIMYENHPYNPDTSMSDFWDMLINDLEYLRKKYNETKDKKYWKELIRVLPEAWLQTRTVTMNYSNLRNMYYWRYSHKLTEWHQFCNWISTLPYAKELILYKIFDNDKNL